jgi:hypothetical protein
MLLLIGIAAALTNVLGHMVKDERQGWAIFAAMGKRWHGRSMQRVDSDMGHETHRGKSQRFVPMVDDMGLRLLPADDGAGHGGDSADECVEFDESRESEERRRVAERESRGGSQHDQVFQPA